MSWLSSLSSAPKTLKHTKSNRHSSDPILQSFLASSASTAQSAKKLATFRADMVEDPTSLQSARFAPKPVWSSNGQLRGTQCDLGPVSHLRPAEVLGCSCSPASTRGRFRARRGDFPALTSRNRGVVLLLVMTVSGQSAMRHCRSYQIPGFRETTSLLRWIQQRQCMAVETHAELEPSPEGSRHLLLSRCH